MHNAYVTISQTMEVAETCKAEYKAIRAHCEQLNQLVVSLNDRVSALESIMMTLHPELVR